MSAETPPKLNVGGTSGVGYAPISWTAIASLIVSVLFVSVLLALVILNYGKGVPLIEPWLLVFPVLGVVLAFVARRQILASEGTRTGTTYANYGWWLAIVGGLGYIAYLGAIEFAIRRDAEQAFYTWAEHLKDLDPANPQDPNFYAAAHLTLEPGFRSAVNPKDTATMESKFREPVTRFRQLDVVRVCARNKGNVQFKIVGMKDWQQKAEEINCVLSAAVVTPEGERGFVVPLKATIDKNKVRRWQVVVGTDEFVNSRSLTRYGWLVEYIETNGKFVGGEFLTALSQPGGNAYAFLAYVQPGWTPEKAGDYLRKMNLASDPRMAVCGVQAVLAPSPPNAYEFLTQNLFAKPDGNKLNEQELAKFLFCWNNPGRISAVGGGLRAAPEPQAYTRVESDRVIVSAACELNLGADPKNPLTAKGRVILQITTADEPALLNELKDLKASKAGQMSTPPDDFPARRLNWRVLRIESDTVPLAPLKEPPAPPGSGMRAPGS